MTVGKNASPPVSSASVRSFSRWSIWSDWERWDRNPIA